MRAALATAPGVVQFVERPDPAAPGPGDVLIAPEAVGICGSDVHYLQDDLGLAEFPRVLGHELIASVRAVGVGSSLEAGQKVAVWPLVACGHCDTCRAGRANACPNFSLIGIHTDGGLQDALVVPDTQCFAIAVEPTLATLVEPLSIAIHAVARGRVSTEAVVVFGAGPIGLLIGFVATERGAQVLIIDRLESRLALARELGMQTMIADSDQDIVTHAREWAGGDGPPVVFDATGAPVAVDNASRLVRNGGRVILVGLPGERAAMAFGPITHKEIDLLGSSCCTRAEFAEAVELMESRGRDLQLLISGDGPLEQAGELLKRIVERPSDWMKLVIRVGGGA